MTDDLVKRLREHANLQGAAIKDGCFTVDDVVCDGLLNEAADRIAALEAELTRLKAPASDEELVEVAAREVSRLRAAEVGGCFRPEDVPQGECVDGDCYCMRQCEREARAVLAAVSGKLMAMVVPDGWKLVPVEPTDEMYHAALRITRNDGYGHVHDGTGGAVYRAMLAAAPKPTAALAKGG